MGYPGKNRKSYDTPKHPWQAGRIAEELELVKSYGLRNKREVWKTESKLRKYRRMAREILAETAKGELTGHIKKESEDIMNRLKSIGLLGESAVLDDILSLDSGKILERRLQTQVYRQGLANTIKQARQFIVHGHITVSGYKVTVPSYLVSKQEELQLGYYTGSPLKSESHPSRPVQVIAEKAALQQVPQAQSPEPAQDVKQEAK
ncbi:MAG TPA: 30S ribosomal protein S4 [Candidatus Methanoperedenaceae archaeon]|nr:30S ribosomal protein S4 [Candidatus Methanoperedenaceae archaeon]